MAYIKLYAISDYAKCVAESPRILVNQEKLLNSKKRVRDRAPPDTLLTFPASLRDISGSRCEVGSRATRKFVGEFTGTAIFYYFHQNILLKHSQLSI